MSLRLLYLIFVRLCGWLVLPGRSSAEAAPAQRYVPQDVLGVRPLAVIDASQTQLWRDRGPQEVVVEVTEQRRTLPAEERAALRLAAGTSPRAVGRTINKLLANRPLVTQDRTPTTCSPFRLPSCP